MRCVAVTGASGYVGGRLLRYLESDPEVDRVLALDLAQPAPGHPAAGGPKTAFVRHDVTRPFGALLAEHRVDAAVHLAFILDPTHDRARERAVNVGGTERFLEACHEAGVGTVLLASSSTAYGAWPDNPPLLVETDPLRGKPGFPYVEDKVALEGLASAWADEHPDARTLLTRATIVCGANLDNFISRYLERTPAVLVRGADPATPLVHEDDVAEATWRILAQAPAGAYNLNAEGPLPLSELARRIGARTVALPPALLYPLAGAAWKLRLRRLAEAPPAMVDYLRWSWVSDGTKVTRETDFRYTRTAEEAFEEYVGSWSSASP